MSRFKRLSSGFLLGFGTLFLVVGVHSFHDQTVSPGERNSDGLACLLLGTYMTAWGGWSSHRLRRRDQQQKLDRLRSIFFHTLQQTNGSINTLQFAIAANLPGAEAKQFLEQQAKEFAADCEVDDRGGLLYRFNTNTSSLSGTQPPTTSGFDTGMPSLSKVQLQVNDRSIGSNVDCGGFDVILEFTPYRQIPSLLRVVQSISGLDTEAAKEVITHAPQFVKRNVSRAVAEDCQRQLEAVGAIVTIRDYHG